MARRETAARRYGEAAFETGRAERSLDDWERDLARLTTVLGNPTLRALVEHPGVSFGEKERILRRIVGDSVAPQPLNLILLMVRRGRPRSVPRMIERFEELLRRERGVVRAEVRTALPLEESDRTALTNRLRQLTGDTVQINEQVDASLIGGIAVRIGDQLYDASVRSRLERLRARLTSA